MVRLMCDGLTGNREKEHSSGNAQGPPNLKLNLNLWRTIASTLQNTKTSKS